MSVDIWGTNCSQCVSMGQCCFTSTETVSLIRTGSWGRLPRLSHSSWAELCFSVLVKNLSNSPVTLLTTNQSAFRRVSCVRQTLHSDRHKMKWIYMVGCCETGSGHQASDTDHITHSFCQRVTSNFKCAKCSQNVVCLFFMGSSREFLIWCFTQICIYINCLGWVSVKKQLPVFF